MRLILTTLALLSAILGVVLSILPLGNIALLPIILALLLGCLSWRITTKEGQNTRLIKFIFLVTFIAICLTIYQTIFDENVVEDDIESIQNEEESLEDAKKELEDIEID
jgi:hypothetical protein